MNWRTLVLSSTILFVALTGHYSNLDSDVYVAEPNVYMEPVVVEQESIESKIKKYFPRSHVSMIAIAHAESGMNPEAKNWNCYYNKNETIVYSTRVKGSHSTACKKQHRKYAWSVDCGILQLSVKGKECPNEDIDTHLQKAANLSRVQGKDAWVVYKTGAYKKYLADK